MEWNNGKIKDRDKLVSKCMLYYIASYNDTNVSSREIKKATLQSFALVGRHTYLMHYDYVPIFKLLFNI